MNRIRIEVDTGELDPGFAANLINLIERSVEAALETARLKVPADAELSILLADDARLQELNRDWRDKDAPTNVLSFPGSDIRPGETSGQFIGDIAVSLETVEREAMLENKLYNDHFCHLIVHGFLHLFGYDHETDLEAETMENTERAILSDLGIADPYESN